MKVEIGYLGRVEGEGGVKFEVRNGRLESLELNIWEPPRFFEGFLVGRKFDEVPDIVARICGICPISHMTTAIRAMEKALALEVPAQTVALQRLMGLSQLVASHLVHLYMLALPDYHRFGSVADMLPSFGKELQRLMRMKEVMNDIGKTFGGRALHPVAMVVAGFTKMPDRAAVSGLTGRLREIRDDALETVRMVAELEVPELAGENEFVALTGDREYGLNRGRLFSEKGMNGAEDDYSDYFAEEQVSHANAKRTVVRGRGPLMVGALARVNLNFAQLHPAAKEVADLVGFSPVSRNPFHNNLAQAIEVVHGINECIELLASLPGGRPWVEIEPRAGRGSAVTEAPRGLLHHSYTLNRQGVVEEANIVTPTSHNFLGLEENLRRLIESSIAEPREEIARKCEMLVRAYDPCFSCSVH
jgi:sulfhydrogenase subunit alpha